MVNVMVERATSDMLIGPDWAMNIEICDICNHDPAQAKDVVRGVKKRLVSKNLKVQLLALTLLETIVKNCGDIVHMHVAEKDLPHEMVKIVKKKPDFHVKEKILILIDTWQESFGGPAARYPQFFVAYQDLLRLGAVFPQRPEKSAPIFTPLQTHPLTSYPQNLRSPEVMFSTESTSSLPPPPWEAALDSQLGNSQSQETQAPQGLAAHSQPSPSGIYSPVGLTTVANSQPVGMYMHQLVGGGHLAPMGPMHHPSQQMGMGMYSHPMQSGHMGGGYGYGYGQQGQQQNAQYLQQGMSGLSVRDDIALRNSVTSKPEDKLFGDLVDMSKFRPGKTTQGRPGSM